MHFCHTPDCPHPSMPKVPVVRAGVARGFPIRPKAPCPSPQAAVASRPSPGIRPRGPRPKTLSQTGAAVRFSKLRCEFRQSPTGQGPTPTQRELDFVFASARTHSGSRAIQGQSAAAEHSVGPRKPPSVTDPHHPHVALMPDSAKFASGLYGPFKSASQSTPQESLHAG